jgi:urea transport system substrate-binding protein
MKTPKILAALAALALGVTAQAADKVKVGVLHSLSGTMAISETSLKDVLLFTFDEINKAGGVKVGGKPYLIEPVVVDPASNWPLFAEKAEQLLVKDKVSVVFGCWTSVSRKSCLPVFERNNGLLFYPVQYEGEELSKNIFYTAEAVNQQAVPAVDYMLAEGKKKFYLLGSDYVYPRTTNKILKQYLKSKGIPDSDIEEIYTPFGHTDYQTIVASIKKFSAGGKACIISTLNGDTNVPFFKEFANAGLTSENCPVVSGQTARRPPRLLDLLHVHQVARKRQVRRRLPQVDQGSRRHRRGLQGQRH